MNATGPKLDPDELFNGGLTAQVIRLTLVSALYHAGTLKRVALPATAAFITGGAAAVPAALAAAVGLGTLVGLKDDEKTQAE